MSLLPRRHSSAFGSELEAFGRKSWGIYSVGSAVELGKNTSDLGGLECCGALPDVMEKVPEHLAKVGVEGSNPFARSSISAASWNDISCDACS